jgi:signal transduction histidine kinase
MDLTMDKHEPGEEDAWLRAIVENVAVGLVVVDLDGNVQLVNDQAREMLGAELEVAPDHLSLDRALRTGDAVRKERIHVRPDGSEIVIDTATIPVRASGGRIIGVLGLLEDVTEQERHERAERAEREFVTNAAHELQSPLAGLISAVEVLQAGAKNGPERDVFLGHIERESNRLARLARALLILARTQTGVERPRDEVVALDPLLSDVAAALRPAAGVAVDVSCPKDLAVVTNRELIEQALSNVAENAAKYTSKGWITLAARRLASGAEIVVTDTGPGIPEGQQDRVTERFFRGADGSNGFGLGLAIVRSAIQAIEGELEVDRADVGGTVVRIRLKTAAKLVESD